MGKNGKGRPLKGAKVHTDKISPSAKKVFRRRKVKLKKKVRMSRGEIKADKYKFADIENWECPKLLHCYEGYDILENIYFARHYIMMKYGHKPRFLEILLFLYPKKYFTIEDYFPLSHICYTWRFPLYLVRKGYVNIVAYPKEERELRYKKIDSRYVYTLSPKGKAIVEEFYGLLSGEMKYPESEKENAFAKGDKPIDQQRYRLTLKLNKLPVSENKRKFFEPKKD